MNLRRSPFLAGFLTSLLSLISAPAVGAQTTDPQLQARAAAQPGAEPAPPPPPPTEQREQPPADQQPAEAEPAAPDQTEPAAEAPAEPGAPTVEDRLAELEGKMEGLSEPFSATLSDVASLKRLKVSGYVQGRYEWHDDANYGQIGRTATPDVTGSGNPRNRGTNRFHVRRARLKTTYAGTLSEFVLQIDATGDGVALRDAEASFHLTNENPWIPSVTPWELKLTMGQFKIPFGFEVLQSSSDREFMERARVIGLFPGERDRGFRLQYIYDFFRLSAAVINGVPIGSNDPHGTFDQSSWKDVVGRIGGDFEFLAVGVSGHVGRFLKLTRAAMPPDVVAGYERYKRLRLGSDAQFYQDVPGLGGLQLRGELIWARDQQMDFGGVAAPAAKCNDVKRFGWYGAVIQNFGDFFALAVRYEQWDPITSLPGSCTDAKKRDPAEIDRVDQLSVALLGHVSGNLKATLQYDHLFEHEDRQVDNDAVTFQLQAKF